jgi:ADP-ribose pyrophosphatase
VLALEVAMSESRKAVIHKTTRLFDDFFKIDEVMVSHEQRDGTMSPDERRLIFERGDSVAVILLNLDTESVVVVNQFKVPSLFARRRDDPKTVDGWITEATAGMIDKGETPGQAIIRETEEETGYRIADPTLISRFFSSPGGTSERIFLYFAEVRESDRVSDGGGVPGEDVSVLNIPVSDLFAQLDKGQIEDPKLAIGAYWLKDYVRARAESNRALEAVKMTVNDLFKRLAQGEIRNPELISAASWLQEHRNSLELNKASVATVLAGLRAKTASGSGVLPASVIRYGVTGKPGLTIGYHTGALDDVKNVSIWVNSENTDMLMDRVIGRSISARIRLLGANREPDGSVVEDLIAEALRNAVGQRGRVDVGTVFVTGSGQLKVSNQVDRILHVATVVGRPGVGVEAQQMSLALCTKNVLAKAEEINKRLWTILIPNQGFHSILIPMFGSGEGGLAIEQVAPIIIPEAIEHLSTVKNPMLQEIYFLAYTGRAKGAIDRVLQQYCLKGQLSLLK